MTLKAWMIGLVALGSLTFATAAYADLVQNGGFETTTLSSPGGYICKTGTTCVSNVANWTSSCNSHCGTGATVASLLFAGTNGSAFNGGNGLWAVADSTPGGNYIAIDGDPIYRAPLSQTITGLVMGDTYTLQFYQAAAQQHGTNGATTEQWQVSLGASTQFSTLMSIPSHSFKAWALESMTFVAEGTTQVLTFLAVGTPGGDPPVVLLDGVSLIDATVPEPGTLSLMVAGLFGMGSAVRLRRKAV